MKKVSLKAIAGFALAVTLVLAAARIPVNGQNGKARRIEGTWRVEITLRNCETGAAIGTQPGLHTFLAGGSMLSNPAVSPLAQKNVAEKTGENPADQSSLPIRIGLLPQPLAQRSR